MHLCPSGLRGSTQVRVYSYLLVKIPPNAIFLDNSHVCCCAFQLVWQVLLKKLFTKIPVSAFLWGGRCRRNAWSTFEVAGPRNGFESFENTQERYLSSVMRKDFVKISLLCRGIKTELWTGFKQEPPFSTVRVLVKAKKIQTLFKPIKPVSKSSRARLHKQV